MQGYAFSSKRLHQAIKTIFVVIVVFALFLILKEKQASLSELSSKLDNIITSQSVFLLICVLLLTPINWAFEALKWQKLASKIEKVSFPQAYRGVLVGLSMSTATPLMLGDYAGKILMLKSDKRIESIGAIMLGNGMQTFVSIIFGWLSYVFFVFRTNPKPFIVHSTIIFLLGIIVFIGIFAALRLQKIVVFLYHFKYFQSISKYLQVLQNYSFQNLQEIFFIATIRYFIFSLQFLLIFYIFQINLSLEVLLAGIGIVFLAKTIASVINFIGDLSLRSLTAIYYFNAFGADISIVGMATLLLWLINILLPVLVGSVFIWQLRLSK